MSQKSNLYLGGWHCRLFALLTSFYSTSYDLSKSDPKSLKLVDGGNCSPGSPCGRCEGDCDNDLECQPGLLCFHREANEPVDGCLEGGAGDVFAKDYCYGDVRNMIDPPESPPNSLRNVGCSSNLPCGECEGHCVNDSHCRSTLTCLVRSGSGPVPGCVTGYEGDVPGNNYCYEDIGADIQYLPGQPGPRMHGMILSQGLSAKLIATKSEQVSLYPTGKSAQTFHTAPDGAAVFADEDTGGWIYVSNSESTPGGVGAIVFDSSGNVIDYKRLVEGDTNRNCGGGKTYWNTWLTCEEKSGGQVYEVDPWGRRSPTSRMTRVGGTGGSYESAAYYRPDLYHPTFYVTTDASNGPLLRYTPDPNVVANAVETRDYSQMLHGSETDNAVLEYLLLYPDPSNANVGTFSWTTSRSQAESNASRNYPTSEGIDIRDGMLYFTCKEPQRLFILDLEALTYKRSSTRTGAFENQPDQLARLVNNDDGIVYFCEDAGSGSGVHGRDLHGNFYTILIDDENAQSGYGSVYGETTGLAFSPDQMHMYVAYQSPGKIFDITRTDGLPFNGQRLDIKYHDPDNTFAWTE